MFLLYYRCKQNFTFWKGYEVIRKRKLLITSILLILIIFPIQSTYATNIDVAKLISQNERLKEENQRLQTKISQYETLTYSLVDENNSLKTNLIPDDANSNSNSNETNSNSDNENLSYLGEFTLTHYPKEIFSGYTATETLVTPGRTIAVDPNVIPLGTKVYIEGYGYRIAEDTGGGIKGNKIDIGVATYDEAIQLGKKSGIKVWIVNE